LVSGLKKQRERAGFKSQSMLADASSVDNSTIARLERGETKPMPDTLKKLAPILKISYEELMRAAGYLKPNSSSTPEQKIAEALADDTELFDFWQELKGREDLRILFKQVKPLSEDSIRRIIKYIKIVEDEIAKER
jgi:transcriptional regulator with XRE-family HTH domain